MSKIHRLRTTHRIFFVTVNLRKTVAHLNESEFPQVIDAFEESRRRLAFALCAYVLMPDHWHALIWPRHPATISRIVQDLKYVSARKLNRQRETSGPVWQHQFWDRFVRHAKEMSDRVNYLHLNPVRKGLVARPEDWKWSSYNNFAVDKSRLAACPIQIDYARLPDEYRG